MTQIALAALFLTLQPLDPGVPIKPFAITVVDEQTGRGVPLVELKTVNEIRYVTDSQGIAAIDEPGLMDRQVFFFAKSHGYEFAADGFGYRGKALNVTPGGTASLKIRRINIAERLYRVTGGGIYRDCILVGRPAPIREPLLNAQVLGQDSVLMAPYRGKLQWFWGDTNRPSYPLGNFHTPGATSEHPKQGGLDPELGINLTYYGDENGFARPTANLPGPGPTWLGGLATFHDESGREQLVAGYAKVRPNMETYEHGLVVFDPEKNLFQKRATFSLKSALRPSGHTFHDTQTSEDFIHYTTPFPLIRVRAKMADLADETRYEAFTCLQTGTKLEQALLDRTPEGRLHYAWRANTPIVGAAEQVTLIREGKIKEHEALLALHDVEAGKPIIAHGGTVNWNPYRKRWVAIILESFGGPSFLGEVWYAEADTPLGPWVYARKVVTHEKYSFYNPKHHPEFDKDAGRVIFFEGTYATTFSGNTDPTPRYDYNQVMYKLSLDDPRLNLPIAFYEHEGTLASGPDAAKRGDPPAFFALDRPATGTIPVFSTPEGLQTKPAQAEDKPIFHAYAFDAKKTPKSTAALLEFTTSDGKTRAYTTEPARAPKDFQRSDRPVALVWPAPSQVRLPTP